MELIIVFSLFILCMGVSLALGVTMIVPLFVGLVLFFLLAGRRGFSFGEVLRFAWSSLKEGLIVIVIMLIIGSLTGMWRLSGTVAWFVHAGVRLVPPNLFLLAAFLLSAVMSFALGTSFGVSATAGVILITIARAGGVNPLLAGGAILSGVYVGDRGSPAASSANLVAVLTHTDMRYNVRAMLKTSLVPFFITAAVFGILSPLYPMAGGGSSMQELLAREFSLHWSCLIPAVLMVVLPFAGLDVKLSMLTSLVSAAVVAAAVQGATFPELLKAAVLGYTAKDPALTESLSGGGIVSMLEVTVILIISCSYGGIFQKTGMLSGITDRLQGLAERKGRFPVMLLLGIVCSALFCNQTIACIMQDQLAASMYGGSEEECRAKMMDMENSVILVAGLVPWCIACSVPRAMLDVGPAVIPLNTYLWLVPLWWLLRSKKRSNIKGSLA